uniref:ZP domain-containing protein n=1 Tax=Panagrellus redivivus TaxID=6233 RepID=A0A7E4ZZY4_PANRE
MPLRICLALTLASFLLHEVASSLLEDKEVLCTTDKIIVNLAFVDPFEGIVFAQNHFTDKDCQWRGTGGRYLLVVVPLDNATTTAAIGLPRNDGFCGLSYNPEKTEHFLTLVISPSPIILTEESFALTIRCVHSPTDLLMTLAAPSMDSIKLTNVESLTVLGTGGAPPQIGLQILEGHGLYGNKTTKVKVGQKLTLDATLKDTSIYDFFIHSCIAHDGSYAPDAYIDVSDANGCAVPTARAVDAPVFVSAPQKNLTKHVYIHLYGFQFSTSNVVHFECNVTPCVYECQKKQCSQNPLPVALPPRGNYTQRGAEIPDMKIQTIVDILPPVGEWNNNT